MKTVWKYALRTEAPLSPAKMEIAIKMPIDAVPLSVGMQGGLPCIWVFVPDTSAVMVSAEMVERPILLLGTGNETDEDIRPKSFVGTYLESGYVTHVFMLDRDVR
jgi:hypothetical protein